jgi:hypothetical protein
MALVVCDEIGPGMRPSERTVAVKDVYGRREFLRADADFLTPGTGGRHYITVGLVHVDPKSQAVLIELPHEAYSGANRLWVRPQDLLDPVETPA